MRFLSVFALVLLSACATGPTLEELEDQAMLTGNWAEVEKRERSLVARQARQGLQCPDGSISYCKGRYGGMRCTCMSAKAFACLRGAKDS